MDTQRKKYEGVACAVRRLLLPYKKHVHTITTYNEYEFAEYLNIIKWIGANVYTLNNHIAHGKRELLKMQTSSLGKIFLNTQTSMPIQQASYEDSDENQSQTKEKA